MTVRAELTSSSRHPLAGQTMTGADMVIQVLADEGVEIVFGYSGGAILPTWDALGRHNIEQGSKRLFEQHSKSPAAIVPDPSFWIFPKTCRTGKGPSRAKACWTFEVIASGCRLCTACACRSPRELRFSTFSARASGH